MGGKVEVDNIQTIQITLDDINNLKQTILELQSKIISLEVTINNLLSPTFRMDDDANIQG